MIGKNMAPKKSGGRIMRKRFKACKIKVVSVSTSGNKRTRSVDLHGSTSEVKLQNSEVEEIVDTPMTCPSTTTGLLESDGEDASQSNTNLPSKHQKRRTREFEEWEKIRERLLSSRYEVDFFVEGIMCCQCDSPADVRCKDCGHDVHYCYNCAKASHGGRNYFHVLEMFKAGFLYHCFLIIL
ncbi:uncharacterized protein LOC114540360 [Dendronephthya gigantea]|uniref:uncharacterized protein LOC114540360 n=1 Tax=Dendronephthya gigantea TaxID=151771 RepID=UPI00106C6C53|nr:uncharacterized protein LOC114540360 [Dendronephthya gigantea]